MLYDPNTYFESNQSDNNVPTEATYKKQPSKRFLEEQTEAHLSRFSKSNITEERVLELSALPVVKLPSMYYASYQFVYRYLSKFQGTKYAVTAVHTPQEKALFDIMLDDSTENLEYSYLRSKNGLINFDLMAAAWSKLCTSTNYIYYKTPEHLCSYNNILEDRKKYRDTVAYNLGASRSIRTIAQSKRRYKISVSAKKHRRLEHIDTTTVRTITSGNSIEENSLILANIAPKPPVFTTSSDPSVILTNANLSNSMPTIIATGSSNIIRKKRAPRKCQLCQQYSSVCKGNSKPQFCQFKYSGCVKSECPARFGGKEKCSFK